MAGNRLSFRSESRDAGILVYVLEGDLFGSTGAYDFQEDVRAKLGDGARGIVIDLAGVVRIDSTGIGVLVALMWSASGAGGGMVLASIPARVGKILDIAMLLDHIDHAASVDEAVAKLQEMSL
jgi:anti-sigma B factor antagonist